MQRLGPRGPRADRRSCATRARCSTSSPARTRRSRRAVARLPSDAAPGRADAAARSTSSASAAGPAFEALRPAVRAPARRQRPAAAAGRGDRAGAAHEDPPVRARGAARTCATCGRRPRTCATASPDLRESFFELNRLFNMAAYNPGGARGPDRQRGRPTARAQEGFLFWLGWVVAQHQLAVRDLRRRRPDPPHAPARLVLDLPGDRRSTQRAGDASSRSSASRASSTTRGSARRPCPRSTMTFGRLAAIVAVHVLVLRGASSTCG